MRPVDANTVANLATEQLVAGTPRSFALASSSAFSIAPSACATTPPAAGRVAANSFRVDALVLKAFCPMVRAESRWIAALTPGNQTLRHIRSSDHRRPRL